MKPQRLILPLLLLLAAGAARADRPDSGFFLGGAARVSYMEGTGTWNGVNFAIDAPLSDEGNALGFAWDEKLLLGASPSFGYYLNESLSLQCTIGWNFPKSSSQTFTETNGGIIYQQGFTSEWTQRSAELVMAFHSTSDLAYFLYGGASLVRVDHKITLFEGSEFTDPFGNTIFQGESSIYEDDFSTLGFLFGVGFEFPTQGNNRVIFVSAQYEASRNNGPFHGTEDFNVDVGGFTMMLGIKWFPFVK